MSYEKQTWTTGDIITAEKLNHIENGIENSNNSNPLIIFTPGNSTTEVRCNYTTDEVAEMLGKDIDYTVFRPEPINAVFYDEYSHQCTAISGFIWYGTYHSYRGVIIYFMTPLTYNNNETSELYIYIVKMATDNSISLDKKKLTLEDGFN